MSRLTKEECLARKAAFQKMSLSGKAEYIYTYYKLPILLGLIALYLCCSALYRQLTKKEVILYSAHINLSVGDELNAQLNERFVSASGADPKRAEIYLYSGLYLSNNPSLENYEYQYASNLKLMAAIEAKQLDIVLMNQEAYDIFSQKGYLLDLHSLLPPGGSLYSLLEPHLMTNTVILEDNAIEYSLNEATRYQAVTEEVTNGLDVSAFPLFQDAGFQDPVYLGVVGNSPRLSAAVQYIKYLAAVQNTEEPADDRLS